MVATGPRCNRQKSHSLIGKLQVSHNLRLQLNRDGNNRNNLRNRCRSKGNLIGNSQLKISRARQLNQPGSNLHNSSKCLCNSNKCRLQQQQPVQSSPTQSGWQTPQTSSTGQSDWQQPGSTGTTSGSTPLLGEVLQQEQRGGTPPPANTMAPMEQEPQHHPCHQRVLLVAPSFRHRWSTNSTSWSSTNRSSSSSRCSAVPACQIMPQGGGGGLGGFKGGFQHLLEVAAVKSL